MNEINALPQTAHTNEVRALVCKYAAGLPTVIQALLIGKLCMYINECEMIKMKEHRDHCLYMEEQMKKMEVLIRELLK